MSVYETFFGGLQTGSFLLLGLIGVLSLHLLVDGLRNGEFPNEAQKQAVKDVAFAVAFGVVSAIVLATVGAIINYIIPGLPIGVIA